MMTVSNGPTRIYRRQVAGLYQCAPDDSHICSKDGHGYGNLRFGRVLLPVFQSLRCFLYPLKTSVTDILNEFPGE